MNYRIAASMACADPICMRQDFEWLEESIIDTYHFDFCDGLFAPTFLLNPAMIRALRPLSTKRFDVHLYCHYPSTYLDELKQAGADLVVVQLETEGEPYLEAIQHVLDAGMEAGLGILPTSQVPDDLGQALSQVSQVVVNTVGPAYAGQPFNPNGLTNMKAVMNMAKALDLDIEIAADGGVRAERLPDFIDAGCNHFICGTSSLFKPNSDLIANAADFKQALDTAINNS
jgi:ribulose-phosphate 3-epimerase